MLQKTVLAACAVLCLSLPAAAQDFGNVTIDLVMTRLKTCIASHYGHGDHYNGRRTASGEILHTYRDLTAAMRRPVPFGTMKTVTNLANGRSVRVRINDRGPFVKGRCIDLSYAAKRAIGMGGLARVTVE